MTAFYVLGIRLCGIPGSTLGPLSAGGIAVLWSIGFAKFALRDYPKPIHMMGGASFGIVVCAYMKFLARYPHVPDMGWMSMVMGMACLFCVMSYSFVGWCLAIPDRPLTERRRVSLVLQDLNIRAAGDKWAIVAIAWPLVSLYFCIAPTRLTLAAPILACGMGAILKVRPLDQLRATWRTVVLWFTYEVPRSDEPHIYTFVDPWRDYRLRILLSTLVVALAAVTLAHWTGWPPTFPARAAWDTTLVNKIAIVAIAHVELAIAAAGVVLFGFVALFSAIGPCVGYFYKEFAKKAIEEVSHE